MNIKIIRDLVNTCKGKNEADVIIENGKILNVFTDEIIEDSIIAIKSGFIFYVGPMDKTFYGTKTEVINADGSTLVPGFIDAHTHLDSIISFDKFTIASLKGGTTAIVTECAMIANACGFRGVLSFLKSIKGYLVKAYFLAPPLTPPLPEFETSEGLNYEEFEELLKMPNCVGIGEAYWTEAVLDKGGYFKKAQLAINTFKKLEGHAAGAKGRKFLSYLNCGITSCHESITFEEAKLKLNNGIYVMVREGFIRKELEQLWLLKDFKGDKKRLILVSDVFDPLMLSEGYMNLVVKKAIHLGFDAVDAIKMATINPSDYFGLRFHGAIAPFRYADILFVDSLKSLNIKMVMSSGKIVVKNDECKIKISVPNVPKKFKNSLKVRHLTSENFKILTKRKSQKVRVLHISSPTIIREDFAILSSKNGYLLPHMDEDIIYAYVVNRKFERNELGKGFIKGTGIKEGAVATSLTWDTGNIIVLASNIEDAELSVKEVVKDGGGFVVVRNNKVIFRLPLPYYGFISSMSIKDWKKALNDFEEALKNIGSKIERPFLTLQTIPFTGLPFLRITDKGLVDIVKMKKVSLFVKD